MNHLLLLLETVLQFYGYWLTLRLQCDNHLLCTHELSTSLTSSLCPLSCLSIWHALAHLLAHRLIHLLLLLHSLHVLLM